MPRIFQKKAEKGGQRWLQELVNNHPDLFSNEISKHINESKKPNISFLSPLKSDFYAEYQDESFLKLLSIELERYPLAKFWPKGGPVWDGLGKSTDGDNILIEAKSHIQEFRGSPCRAASDESLALIQSSLSLAAEFYGADPSADWTHEYYQLANRLAHLYLLRELNSLPAWLVVIYFVNDTVMKGPDTVEKWQAELERSHQVLGLNGERLKPYLIDLFIDVRKLG